MDFYRLTSTNDVLFNKAFDLYKASFPEHEQRLFEDQIVTLNNSEYHCDVILEKDVFVGIIFYWETSGYTYIEHFAIGPDMRGNNIGSRCLQKFCDLHSLVILEIDPPVESISIRRKNFYMRLGFMENHYQHKHPAYRKQNLPHELVIMSFPRSISEFEYMQFNEYLVKTIMKSGMA
ncbi:GNAT family N-acetyltransferase [Brevibacillus laterosporus]|uniref:GNAT family N-acetyltransferase n=1 Tax=Brevibacillus laterosporus TaxID=1465 RepID=UPI000B9B370C|nr:GNAT family N-acetyltransferase [Brevibacillus laterosporus]MCG7319782.1 GNAT family N-acetyltransferase [Brevibacillus laterosporus]MED1787763.1 GNAT family N-acetyltransferase [Brevibacillus laterosporus]